MNENSETTGGRHVLREVCAKSGREGRFCAVTGVDRASVNFVTKTATVGVQDALTNEVPLIEAVQGAAGLQRATCPFANREADENRAGAARTY